MIHGKFIPGGTTVVGLLLPAMRSAQHRGDDADMFRPERFLDVDDKTRAGESASSSLGLAMVASGALASPWLLSS